MQEKNLCTNTKVSIKLAIDKLMKALGELGTERGKLAQAEKEAQLACGEVMRCRPGGGVEVRDVGTLTDSCVHDNTWTQTVESALLPPLLPLQRQRMKALESPCSAKTPITILDSSADGESEVFALTPRGDERVASLAGRGLPCGRSCLVVRRDWETGPHRLPVSPWGPGAVTRRDGSRRWVKPRQ